MNILLRSRLGKLKKTSNFGFWNWKWNDICKPGFDRFNESYSSFNFLFIQMCFIRSPADLPPIINFFHSPHTHFLCLYEIFMIKNCKLARLFYEWPKDTKTIINHNYILLLTLLLPIKMQLYSIVVVSIRITYHQTVQVGRGCNIATAAIYSGDVGNP